MYIHTNVHVHRHTYTDIPLLACTLPSPRKSRCGDGCACSRVWSEPTSWACRLELEPCLLPRLAPSCLKQPAAQVRSKVPKLYTCTCRKWTMIIASQWTATPNDALLPWQHVHVYMYSVFMYTYTVYMHPHTCTCTCTSTCTHTCTVHVQYSVQCQHTHFLVHILQIILLVNITLGQIILHTCCLVTHLHRKAILKIWMNIIQYTCVHMESSQHTCTLPQKVWKSLPQRKSSTESYTHKYNVLYAHVHVYMYMYNVMYMYMCMYRRIGSISNHQLQVPHKY